jgi:hypothetical protein
VHNLYLPSATYISKSPSFDRLVTYNQSIMSSGFPSLKPAFTVRVVIDPPMPVGGQAGSQLVIVPMVSGTVQSEPGFEPKLDGELYAMLTSLHSCII